MNDERWNLGRYAEHFGRGCRRVVSASLRATNYGGKLGRQALRMSRAAVREAEHVAKKVGGTARTSRACAQRVGRILRRPFWAMGRLLRWIWLGIAFVLGAIYHRLALIRRETWAVITVCAALVMCSGTRSSNFERIAAPGDIQFHRGRASSLNAINGPSGVAVDKDGNIYVSTRYGDGVQVFNKDGDVLRSFGGSNSRDDYLSQPRRIAIADDGRMFVTNSSGRKRIFVYKPNGELEHRFVGDATLPQPEGLTVTPTGELYVTDTRKHQVLAINSEGQARFSIGRQGNASGEFMNPSDVAVDSNGRVIVADSGNCRIQVFGADGEFRFSFGQRGRGDGQFEHPCSVAVDADNSIIVADSRTKRVQVFSPDGQFLYSFGQRPQDGNRFSQPSDVNVDAAGNIAVADSGNHSIQVFSADGVFRYAFGRHGRSEGQLYNPSGVAFGKDGQLVVVDRNNNRLQVFDKLRNPVRVIGSRNRSKGVLNDPVGLAIADNGDVVVCDTDNHRVQVFDKWGNFKLTFGRFGGSDGQFHRPEFVVIDSQNRIIVSDEGRPRIQVFDAEGGFLFAYNSGVRQPQGMHIDEQDHIWLTDRYSADINVFDSNGKRIRKIHTNAYPLRKAIPVGDRIFAVSFHESGVLVLDKSGNKVDHFADISKMFAGPFGVAKGIGRFITDDSSMYVPYAPDLAAAADGTIILADYRNRCVKLFRERSK